MTEEKKMLIELYEYIQMEGHSRAGISGTDVNDPEFIRKQDCVTRLEDLGYIEMLAKASGFWEFTITQSGIEAVRFNKVE
ncbi:hypothetical protein [Viridibacillus arvi]|uniref:hypothetical protein n=1 Tax=Viridibacillus arvi TaxID=263475 RepID=UPI003CFEED54